MSSKNEVLTNTEEENFTGLTKKEPDPDKAVIKVLAQLQQDQDMTKKKKYRGVSNKTKIHKMRQTGATMREIGEKLGISRERVRQILLYAYGSTRHELLTTAHICSLTGFSINRIMGLYKKGVITPAFKYEIGIQHRFMWSANTIQLIKKYYNAHHACLVCNKPLPLSRTHYCSELCKQERYKYRNLTPEEKQHVRERRLCYREKRRLNN